MFAKHCTNECPKVDWVSLVRKGKKVGDTFVDTDGSVWQIQVDLDTMKIFPARIQDTPRVERLFSGHCTKKQHVVGLKNLE